MRSQRTTLVAGIVVVGLLASLAGCSSSRSVEAACDVAVEYKTVLLESMSAASVSGGLKDLLGAGESTNDLRTMWATLAEVAPAEIQTDAETMRDAWQEQEDAGAGSLVAALRATAPMTRVWGYVKMNCEGDFSFASSSGVAQTEDAATPTPTATPTGVGSFDVTTADGYTAHVNMGSTKVTASASITAAPPGFADISISATSIGELTNTTPGRELPSTPIVDIVVALPADSVFCSTEFDYYSPTGSKESKQVAVRFDSAHCYLGAASLIASSGVGAEARVGLEVVMLTGYSYRPQYFRVPEAAAAAMIAELSTAPLIVAIGASSSTQGWGPSAPVCASGFSGWFGRTFPIVISTDGLGCA